jgi:hypothetical protein
MLQSDQRELLDKSQKEKWVPDNLLAWLIEGFRQPYDDPTVQAFLPLYIYTSRERISQLISALRAIASEDTAFEALLHSTLQSYLNNSSQAVDNSIPHRNNIWHLYNTLGDVAKIEATARSALKEHPFQDVAVAIIETMRTTRISAEAKLRFLQDLRNPDNFAMKNGAYWNNLYLLDIVAAKFAHAETPEARLEIWRQTLTTYGSEIIAVLNPERPPGRVAIRSIARQITGITNSTDTSKESANELLAVLLRPQTAAADISALKAKLG